MESTHPLGAAPKGVLWLLARCPGVCVPPVVAMALPAVPPGPTGASKVGLARVSAFAALLCALALLTGTAAVGRQTQASVAAGTAAPGRGMRPGSVSGSASGRRLQQQLRVNNPAKSGEHVSTRVQLL